MEFRGGIVNHKIFGRGEIIEFENNCVTVSFRRSHLLKVFKYPEDFGTELEFEDEALKEILGGSKVMKGEE